MGLSKTTDGRLSSYGLTKEDLLKQLSVKLDKHNKLYIIENITIEVV